MKKTIAICFTNNKGGSGKSTVCANLGYELSRAGKKVLLIDGDMQMNLTLSYFDEERVLEMAESKKTIYEAVTEKKSIRDHIVHTPYERLDMVPSSTLLSQIEFQLFTMMQREYVLKKCIADVKATGEYDYILIDAPPTLGNWVVNILCASDQVIMPVEASPWGLFGLANMFDFLDSLKEITDTRLRGVLITKVDERKNYYRQTREVLEGYEDIPVFDTVIHVDSSIEWAEDNSVPVAVYRKSTRSAVEFNKLAVEIISSKRKSTANSGN